MVECWDVPSFIWIVEIVGGEAFDIMSASRNILLSFVRSCLLTFIVRSTSIRLGYDLLNSKLSCDGKITEVLNLFKILHVVCSEAPPHTF